MHTDYVYLSDSVHHQRVRTTFSSHQLEELDRAFEHSHYPKIQTSELLASCTRLSENQSQNRRGGLEMDVEGRTNPAADPEPAGAHVSA
ncbi:retina and anterior neural fold homeobox protein 2-like [Dicentrarchus labrax]|uniref:retina and anterior neural fold homeobox protein 2-like n=1 Tax=Dicentrarchus labrax TaxID=13489 RepID=UPI0021F5F42D|nr:retina and anterior neural fold homeobox protein 2-like [Dicentrarchus labrax]